MNFFIYFFYDDKSRLTKIIEEKDITQVTLHFSTTLSSNNFVGAASFTSTKFNYQDILTEYTYSDTSVITNKRTETTKYNSFGDNSPLTSFINKHVLPFTKFAPVQLELAEH